MISHTLKHVLIVCSTALLLMASIHANANTQTKKDKVLIVVANGMTAPTVGWKVGFWASELTHPYHVFEQAGYQVEIASPDGGAVFVDAFSDPRHDSGYSSHDFVSYGFLASPQHASLLDNTQSLKDIDPNDYAAIVVAGGQAPMFTFRNNKTLQNTIKAFYSAGKPTAALCHGVAALIDIKDDKGDYLIRGKKITGFTAEEDSYVDQILGTTLFSWWIEPEAKKRGADFVEAGMWESYAVVDGNLITGQQQNSGTAVAELVIEMLN